jgi:excisionase family DNA binding protein
MVLSHITLETTAQMRPSARVATVAVLLDCHPSDVRHLIHAGDLEAYRPGGRGVRVFLDSVQAHQERQTQPAPKRAAQFIRCPKRPLPPPTMAFRTAISWPRAGASGPPTETAA